MSERLPSASGNHQTPSTRQPVPSALPETRRPRRRQLLKRHTIEWIKRNHPEWVAEDGSCEPCLRHYDEFDADVTFTPVPTDTDAPEQQ